MTRQQINALISKACREAGIRPGWRLDVAGGGTVSKSGIWQGSEKEGGPWAGDFMDIGSVRKRALPGDFIDIYVYVPAGYRDYELKDNLGIQLPDPERKITGFWFWTGEAKKALANRRRRRR